MICLWILLCFALRNQWDKRLETCVKATVVWTLMLLFTAYFWSLFRMLCFETLAASYALYDLILLVRLVWVKRKKNGESKNRILLSGWKSHVCSFSFLELAVLLLLFVLAGYHALRSVPYNWDSMTYHLPRIVNWEQNRSVFPYATHIERQVASPVLAAYVNLFVYILYGNHDRMLNLLQCISYGINAVLLYGIAHKLGVGKKTAYLAPLLYLCTPIALAEATTTQVDHFAALWLLAFLYLIVDLAEKEKELVWERTTGSRILAAALCIALGYLAKPSVLFAALLFLIWLLAVCVKRKTRVGVMIRYCVFVLPFMAAVVLPGMLLARRAFGGVFHSAVGQRQLVGSLNPRYLLMNFLKNVTFNLAFAKKETFRASIEKFLYNVSAFLRVDLNDPGISEDGRMFEFPEIPALSCDVALNTFLFVTALCMFVWFLLRRKKQSQLMRGFSVYAVSAYAVFCCFLRWEKFINRYMISYLALLAIFITVQVYDMIKNMKKPYLYYGVSAVLTVGSLINYGSGLQYLRSVAPFYKPGGYFAYYPAVKDDYIYLTDEIRNSGEGAVGLVLRGDTYEYPIWALLRGQEFEIRHILVDNELKQYEDPGFIPDYIVAERYTDEMISFHQQEYVLKMQGNNSRLALYVQAEKEPEQ